MNKATIIFEDHPTEGVKIHVEFSPPFLQGDQLSYAQRMAIDTFNFIAEDFARAKEMAEFPEGRNVSIETPH